MTTPPLRVRPWVWRRTVKYLWRSPTARMRAASIRSWILVDLRTWVENASRLNTKRVPPMDHPFFQAVVMASPTWPPLWLRHSATPVTRSLAPRTTATSPARTPRGAGERAYTVQAARSPWETPVAGTGAAWGATRQGMVPTSSRAPPAPSRKNVTSSTPLTPRPVA
nr:MAG TPA: hypothetical protein [Caudoviricetes sp.]